MAKKNKKQSPHQRQLSPKKYILTRARTLPLYKCLVNRDWNEGKMASIVVTRKHSTGNITAGFFLVDMLARGVKDTHYNFNIPETFFFEELFQSVPKGFHEEVPYVLVHNIIYGAIAFAEEHNFIQHSDFSITQYLLEEDTDDIELIDLIFGVDDKPFITNFDDDVDDDELTEEDYKGWTDDKWQNFFEGTDSSYKPLQEVVDTLFDKWYHETYPMVLTQNTNTKESSMRITKDALNFDYVNDKTELAEMEKVYAELQIRPSVARVKKLEAKLRQMIEANSKNPILYNYLSLCAQIRNDGLAFREILNKTIEKFPNYLFGKIALANLLIDDGKIDEASAVFSSFYITGVCPDRYTFHISEFIGFHSTLMRLFLHKEDLQQVVVNYTMLNELDDEELNNSNIFLRAEQEFMSEKTKIVNRYMQEKKFI